MYYYTIQCVAVKTLHWGGIRLTQLVLMQVYEDNNSDFQLVNLIGMTPLVSYNVFFLLDWFCAF